jgi:hypothetical protein
MDPHEKKKSRGEKIEVGRRDIDGNDGSATLRAALG